jgi:hypothetical protein
MLVIDTHLAGGASNGGATFHDRGGPFGRTKGAKRIVAVDVTGLPVGALSHRLIGAPDRPVGRSPAGPCASLSSPDSAVSRSTRPPNLGVDLGECASGGVVGVVGVVGV